MSAKPKDVGSSLALDQIFCACFFGFVRLFFAIFLNVFIGSSLQFFLIFCQDLGKSLSMILPRYCQELQDVRVRSYQESHVPKKKFNAKSYLARKKSGRKSFHSMSKKR